MQASTNSKPACRTCRYFRNDAAYLEAQIPGLSALSSGYASVRSNDGICTVHSQLQNERSWCDAFEEASGKH